MEKELHNISAICRKGRFNATFHLAEDSWPISRCAAPIYSQHCHLLPSHGVANSLHLFCCSWKLHDVLFKSEDFQVNYELRALLHMQTIMR